MSELDLDLKFRSRYRVCCYGPDGALKWSEDIHNLVVVSGRNTALDRLFKTIPSSVAGAVGLKGAGTIDAADTMASHAGWSEVTAYGNATRPAYTAGTISNGAVDNSASLATFNMNGSYTAAGAFLCIGDNTKGGTTGTLYGAADFSVSRSGGSGDTITVEIDATAASA